MFGKKMKRMKKIDRKMRRRIRKTSAVMLLISAIVVAAIPVPEAAAANGDTVTYVEEPLADKLEYSVTADDGKIIPKLPDNTKIYKSKGGEFNFAYLNERGVAVLLNVKCGSGLGNVEIPEKVNAYTQFMMTDPSDRSFAAANQYSSPLYYRELKAVTFTRSTINNTYEKTDRAPLDNDTDAWGKWSKLSEGTYEPEGISSAVTGFSDPKHDDVNKIYTQTLTYVMYAFKPCVLGDEAKWCPDNNDKKVPRYVYYKKNNTTGSEPDNLEFYEMPSLPGGTTVEELIPPDGFVKYISSEENTRLKIFDRTGKNSSQPDDDWLMNVPVAYISDQRAGYVEEVNDGQEETVLKLIGIPENAAERPFFYMEGTDYGGMIESVTFPKNLVAIADYAFYGCSGLETVEFKGIVKNSTDEYGQKKSAISHIGHHAFGNCTRLKTFSFPDGGHNVKILANSVFENCKSLARFDVTPEIEQICDSAFKNCSGGPEDAGLSIVDFSQAVKLERLGSNVFEGCRKLSSLVLPSSLTNMGQSNFVDCSNLTEIQFLGEGRINGTKGVSLSNFWGCRSLKFIDVESKDLTFDYKDSSGNYYGYDDGAGKKISGIEKLLNNENSDENFYFKGYDKSNIHEITKAEAIVLWIKDINKYEKIIREYDENGSKTVEYTYQADPDTEEVKIYIDGTPEIVELEESIAGVKVRKIGKMLDKNGEPNTKLKAIRIPQFVTEIGEGAFENCSSLKAVYFDEGCEIAYDPENGISGFGENAFKTQRASAGSISEGAWLTFYGNITLDSGAFRYAMDPDNYFNKVNRVDDRAYIDFCSDDDKNIHVKLNNYGDGDAPDYQREVWKVPTTTIAKLTTHTANDKNDDYYRTLREALMETDDLTYTEDNVDEKIRELIEDYEVSGNNPSFTDDKPMTAFMSAYEITLPSGIQRIAKGLFSEADEKKTTDKDTLNKLTSSSIDIPAAKTDSGGGIFKANTSVRKITMEDVEVLEPYAFYGCTNLKSVEMYPSNKETGESIGDYAFAHCPELTNVKLPDSTVEMGKRPFAGNKVLKRIDFVRESGRIRSNSGSGFSCENQIIYGLKDGVKDSIVQCLEGRAATDEEKEQLLQDVGADELAGVRSIREEAFMNCEEIELVNLSKTTVDSIPKLCFNNAKNLETVVIPTECKTVENYAFKDTDKLKILETKGFNTPTYFPYAFYHSTAKGNVKNGVRVKAAKNSTTYNQYLQYKSLGYGWLWDEQSLTCVTIFLDEDGNEIARHEDPEGWEITKPTEAELAKYFADHPDSRFAGMAVRGWSPKTYTKAAESEMKVEVIFDDTVHVTFEDDGLNLIHEEDVLKGGTIKREPKNVPSVVYPGKTCNMWQSTPAGISPSDIITENVRFMAYYSPSAAPGGSDGTDPNACTIKLYGVYAEYLKGWDIVKTPGSNVVVDQEKELPKSYYDEKTGTTYKIKSWKPLKDTASYRIDTPMDEAGLREFKVDEYEIVSGSGLPNNPNNPNGGNTNGNNSGNNNGNNTSSGNNSNQTLYTLTVVNGSGSGSYTADTMVTVAAYTPNTGYEFYNWTSSESDTAFTSKTMAATAFKMPAKNLTVTANYKTKSETGNSITSKRTEGTVTSAPSSNTGSVNKVNSSTGSNSGNNSSNSGTSIQVSRPGISNGDVASATVNGSTDNFVVKVTEDGQATMAVAEALRNEYGSLDNIHYFAMDISLYDETGTQKITDTSGLSVTITLPIPDELRQYAGNNKVGAVTGGNNLDKLNARFTTVNGVPCVTFTATHFSPYTIYVDTANLLSGGYDTTPKTGDAIHPKWFLAIGLALFSAVLFLKKDKKVSPGAA